MNINSTNVNPKIKEYIDTIKEVIDQAKTSLQEELSQSGNNWTACFATITDTIDNYGSIIRKYIDITDEGEYNKFNEKIEELKRELWNLREKYTEKYMEPTDEEKKSLFTKLSEIKKMIE